ncbi:MAG TPA: hypothetical protein QGF58_16495 [Myxococcota bacterium]|nr:hypothetical protein [Myxococcota bacterium]
MLSLERALNPGVIEAHADDEGYAYIGPEDLMADVLAELIREDVQLEIQ